MPELLSALNYDEANILAVTKATDDALAAQKIILVENTASFTAGKSIVLGSGENAEVVRIDSLTTSQITSLTNLKFKHFKGESIKQLLGNSIRFYSATNVDGTQPDDADFTLLATVPIVPDQLTTSYLHADGSNAWWYKYIYFDTDNTSEYTDLADSIASRGGVSIAYVTVQDVKEEAGLKNNQYISDHEILSKIVKAQSEVNASLRIGRYTLPLVSVPGIVENATLLLAAGYLLKREYGFQDSAIQKEGSDKIAEGRKLLLTIERGDERLTDESGTEISSRGSGRVAGYPMESDATPFFTRDDKF